MPGVDEALAASTCGCGGRGGAGNGDEEFRDGGGVGGAFGMGI